MKKTDKGGSEHFMGIRSPMAAPQHGLIKKTNVPAINENTIRKDIGVGAAKVRSAQTGGKIIKPF